MHNGDNQGAGGVFTGQGANPEPEQNQNSGMEQDKEPAGMNMNPGPEINQEQNAGLDGPYYEYGGTNPNYCNGQNPNYGGQGPVYTDYPNSQGYPCMQQGGYENELEEPVTMGEWVVSLLLIMFVPCVNIVLMFVWAFSKKEKKSKSNFFKAQLIIMGIVLGLYIIILFIFGAAIFASLSA